MAETPDNVVDFPDQNPDVREEHGLTYYLETNPLKGLHYFIDGTIQRLQDAKLLIEDSLDDEGPAMALNLSAIQIEMAKRCLGKLTGEPEEPTT